MNDKMNELVQFSSVAGKLFLETVPGETNKKVEHENDLHAADGAERTMFAYAPRSGCPDAKQTQVLMVLRNGSDEASAEEVMQRLGLRQLAEEEHFLLLFPNPAEKGWNYKEEAHLDNDMEFLGRCFGALRSSAVGVNGFNGMIFYIAESPEASALIMSMAARKPISVPAMMIGDFPADYHVPDDVPMKEVAACVCANTAAAACIRKANGVCAVDGDVELGANPNVRLLEMERQIDRITVLYAWHKVFSQSRRWQNDTCGTYQPRTAFTERGFTAHVKDASLGCNDHFPHTWYEYIPPQLRGTKDKVPLVFYFHGVNCVPLYGAEQSNWHDIADRENFIVVYPAPALYKAWNIYNDPALPSDFDFVLALIEHMKQVHPIDETRIYLSGFSMGAMMTHALSGAYPDLFAAAAPCNAFDTAYFSTPVGLYSGVVKGVDPTVLSKESVQRCMADKKWMTGNFRMPMFQNVGYDDGLIAFWPVDRGTDDVRVKTISRWMNVNNTGTLALDASTLTGIAADESFYEDVGQRLYHQRWHSKDPGAPVLYELMTAKRMPHAIVPRQIEYAWDFIKNFRRMPDGTVSMERSSRR